MTRQEIPRYIHGQNTLANFGDPHHSRAATQGPAPRLPPSAPHQHQATAATTPAGLSDMRGRSRGPHWADDKHRQRPERSP